jgi:hypothetical protein
MCNFNVKNVSTKCLISLNKTWKVFEYISTIIEYQYYTHIKSFKEYTDLHYTLI